MSEDTETTEKKMYSEEEVNAAIRAGQQRQMAADNERAYGNAFYAEALDHIAGLSKTSQFWKDVYAYGLAFKQNFEISTGQIAPPQAPPKQQKPKDADPSQNPQQES
jgi:hypothetical protein